MEVDLFGETVDVGSLEFNITLGSTKVRLKIYQTIALHG
jgi:hypothetical protein